jgi:hypothetical protein
MSFLLGIKQLIERKSKNKPQGMFLTVKIESQKIEKKLK